jgi:predicted phosphodiesterase
MNRKTKKSLQSLGLAAAISLLGTAAFAGVLKKPYLIYEMPNTTMTVLWQDSAVETTNTISWGTDTSYALGSAIVPEETRPGTVNQHKYKITGLAPNTKYYYQVADSSSGQVYGTGSFITAPEENATSVKFIGQGDSRSQPFALNNLMKAVKAFSAQSPDFAEYQRLTIANGDWVSTDGESYWTSEWFVPAMTDIAAYTASTPMDGVKGNHDNSSGYSTTFAKYWPFPYPNATLKAGTAATYNNLYWSMDYGPVHVTYVDEYSSYAPGSAQYNWLVSDLTNTTKPWKILVYHEPSYSSGKDADNVAARALEPLITQYNVDLIFAGHSHNYARAGAYNTAQANGDQIALNVPHFTSGGGGAPIYQPDYSNTGNFPHVITAWPAYQFMTFDVDGKNLTMNAYQINNVSSTAIKPLSSSFPAADGGSTLSLSLIEQVALHHYTNVAAQITATTGTFVYNRATKLYTGNLTLTNNGPSLSGKIDVVLDGLVNLQGIGSADNEYSTASPKVTSKIASKPATGKGSSDPGLATNLTLTNATGSNNGEPMILASSTGLAKGASVTVALSFSNPTNGEIRFNPVTYQE